MRHGAEPVRLGVFGGAFDPPHVAHHALAQAALEQLGLTQLHVVPTGHAWHKSRPLSDAQHRVAMARLAFADLFGVSIDTREIDRAGPTYTIDSLRELLREHPGATLFLIIGQDQAQALQSWREWEQVVALATICVAARPPAVGKAPALTAPAGQRQSFETLQLQLALSAVSATEIRRLARVGQSVVPLVGAAVARYIVLNRLYQTT